MKIKIISCADQMFWYSSYVGATIDVIRESETKYWVRELPDSHWNCINFVLKTDSEAIYE